MSFFLLSAADVETATQAMPCYSAESPPPPRRGVVVGRTASDRLGPAISYRPRALDRRLPPIPPPARHCWRRATVIAAADNAAGRRPRAGRVYRQEPTWICVRRTRNNCANIRDACCSVRHHCASIYWLSENPAGLLAELDI